MNRAFFSFVLDEKVSIFDLLILQSLCNVIFLLNGFQLEQFYSLLTGFVVMNDKNLLASFLLLTEEAAAFSLKQRGIPF